MKAAAPASVRLSRRFESWTKPRRLRPNTPRGAAGCSPVITPRSRRCAPDLGHLREGSSLSLAVLRRLQAAQSGAVEDR